MEPDDSLSFGLFHYNVENHQLEMLQQKEFKKENLKEIINPNSIKDFSLLVFLTAVFWRSQNKYGQRGYRFILLEAGHIEQNIHLISEALNLKFNALDDFIASDKKVEKFLRIDGVTESLIYSLGIG